MATVRLIVVLLVLGVVVLLGVQNLATAIPLVFFGGSTQALPLGVWLVSAIALGAITTLALTILLGKGGGGGQNRSASYKYRPQSFYEPSDPAYSDRGGKTAASEGPGNPPPYQASGPRSGGGGRSSSTSASPRSDIPADDDPSWRAWTNLKSPGQWGDWESLSQAPNPEAAPSTFSGTASSTSGASGIIDGVTTWFSSSKQRAKQQQKINESLRELDDDWGDMENRPYRPPGVSPVQDSMDDIDQGWDVSDPHRDIEASQAPRRVYRDGSIYSYSYRDEADPAPSRGQVDNIYAPPDDIAYGSDYGNDDPGPYDTADDYDSAPGYALDHSDYENSGDDSYDGPDGDDTPLGEPEIAEDGVVDADYRVIVPPYTAAAAATWVDGSDDAPGDDWDEADDALTP